MISAKSVFILGAGASAQAGAPLMRDFLDIAESLLTSGRVGQRFEESFKVVFEAINQLRQAQIKGSIDVDNIESVFAGFEMAKLLERFQGYDQIKYSGLLRAVKTLIARTLELSLRFPISGQRIPPNPYGEFAKLLRDMQSCGTSVFTFNYDIGVDCACAWNGLGLNYCIEGPAEQGIELLKLHGSVNWNYCEKCELVIPNYRPFQQSDMERRDAGGYLDVSTRMAGISCSKCNYSAHEPMLVPPTWSKTQHYIQIKSVWKRAALRISEAENIFVIGYSLPITDEFFRYLFALGTIGPTRIKRFWVFNPDPEVRERFACLLGPEAQKRFVFYPIKFRDAIDEIRQKLSVKSQSATA